MKNVIVILALVLPLFCAPNTKSSENEKAGWYPFVLEERLDPASPANIGKLVLDAPAGKHGFVTARDGRFFFEDGTRARFWGTNLCFSACFPSKEQAEMMAERIAFFGFNAVRFHHMDFYFEPRGIFKDICPECQNHQLKRTGILSKSQLDRLDYLIYQLKKRGVYVDINLLVSRHFTTADGVVDADKFRPAAKPVSMFDPKLIELQKEYAKELLTHYNQYTKLRYSDDPAIALVEITNENSLISYWKSDKLNAMLPYSSREPIPEFYMLELDRMWNNWLRRKYGTVENVREVWEIGEFSVHSPQSIDFQIGKKRWTIEQHKGTKGTREVNGANIILNVENVTDTPWHLQYRTTKVALSKDKNYLLKFTAYADRALRISAISQQADSPWENLGLKNEITLTSKPQIYQIPFKANEDCSNAKVGFIIGGAKGKIFLKDIELKEIETLPFIAEEGNLSEFKFHRPLYGLLTFYPDKMRDDIRGFYISLEKKYFEQMIDFLKRECNAKIPITGIGGYWNYEDIEAQTSCDFIDTHAYWDHPCFPNKRWDRNDFRIHNNSMLLDENLGIIGRILERQKNTVNKPFTITEWNHCYPNQYAYETPVLIASKAVKNDWEGLFQFAFSHGWKFSPEFNDINSCFDIIANPQELILCSLGSFILHKTDDLKTTIENGVFKVNSSKIKGAVGFIKDKTFIFDLFSMKAKQNGVVFLYSLDGKSIEHSNKLTLITISEVKNKDSAWKEGRFNWGNTPTLLKKIVVNISLNIDGNVAVYALDTKGTRGSQIETHLEKGAITFSTESAFSPWFEIIRK